MSLQRGIGFLLIALQAVALGYGFRTWIFSAAVIAAGLMGLMSTLRLATPRTAQRWPLVLAVLYVVQRLAVPQAWYAGAQSFVFPDSCLAAEYFLVFQVGQFFVRREEDRLPSYLPILAMVAMTFAADLQVRGQTRFVFQLFSVGLVFLTACYFAACRQPAQATPTRLTVGRSAILVTVLLATGAIGWFSASNLRSHAVQIERLLMRVTNPPSEPEAAGFSGQGRLGSIASQKQLAGESVALRVWAEQPPGYLRGRVFDTYSRSEWHRSVERMPVPPEKPERLPARMATDDDSVQTFLLSGSGVDAWQKMEIWPNQPFREVVFVPLGSAALQAPVEQLTIDQHGVLETDELPVGTPYAVWSSAPGKTSDAALQRPGTVRETTVRSSRGVSFQLAVDGSTASWKLTPPISRTVLTRLPSDLDPRVRELAGRVAGRCRTDEEKIAAVARYFLENYRYQVGITIPSQEDPLTYFLLNKPPAHCEYFASGAAVLLRAVGVPCRYVTGFVATERNDYGGYWVAKSRDAHAWVEAFDRRRGWVLVEATPASGVPQAVSASRASQIWDAWQARWQRLLAAIRQGGLRAIWGVFRDWLRRPWPWLILLVLATPWAVRRLVRWRRRTRAAACDPVLNELRRLLRQMDDRWRRAGLARQPCETPHQFAARLCSHSTAEEHRQAADWYRRFAAVRYSGRANVDQVRGLGADIRIR